MELMRPNVHPMTGEIVFALNSKGYLSVVMWNGGNWMLPDCKKEEQKNNENTPIFKSIANDIAFWISL